MERKITRRLIVLSCTVLVLVLLICSASFGWFFRSNQVSADLSMTLLNYEITYFDDSKYEDGFVLSPRADNVTLPLGFGDFVNSIPSGYPSGGIAPGYSGTYSFYIKNTGELPATYNISFSGMDTFPGNLTWQVANGSEPASDVTESTVFSGDLAVGDSRDFTITYNWPTNDNSTDNAEDTSYIAQSDNNGKTKTLSVCISVSQS